MYSLGLHITSQYLLSIVTRTSVSNADVQERVAYLSSLYLLSEKNSSIYFQKCSQLKPLLISQTIVCPLRVNIHLEMLCWKLPVLGQRNAATLLSRGEQLHCSLVEKLLHSLAIDPAVLLMPQNNERGWQLQEAPTACSPYLQRRASIKVPGL